MEPSTVGVCESCWVRLRPWEGPACEGCGIPFASDRAMDSRPALCALCRREEFRFDAARSFGLYSGTLRALILQVKFQRRERLGKRLGRLLTETWRAIEPHCEGKTPVLIPVPLHASRQRQRGFNQATLLARGLAEAVRKVDGGAPLCFDASPLLRARPTAPQTGLSLSARHENVRGAFEVVAPERVRERVILLVDDVMTTGATLSACATALKRAGTRRVLAVTLARSVPLLPDFAGKVPSAAVDDPSREQT